MSVLRLLVVGTQEASLMQECKAHGIINAAIIGTRENDAVLEVPIHQYEAVRQWWLTGGRLIRTLGPDEASNTYKTKAQRRA